MVSPAVVRIGTQVMFGRPPPDCQGTTHRQVGFRCATGSDPAIMVPMRLLLFMPPLIYAEHWTRSRTAHLLNLFSWVRKQLPEVEVSVVDLDREMGSITSPAGVQRLRSSVAGILERERALCDVLDWARGAR